MYKLIKRMRIIYNTIRVYVWMAVAERVRKVFSVQEERKRQYGRLRK